jgi:glyceraldehyde 3-phosphate dehydrogenase
MSVKVAINGFGRIGRLAFRLMEASEGFEVVAINDLTDAEQLAYLLKYDSAQGRYQGEVSYEGDEIIVDGRRVKVYAQMDPENLPWKELGIDVVLESS